MLMRTLTGGLLAAVLRLLLVQPVLLAAERYDAGELVHRSGEAPDHAVAPTAADGTGSTAAGASTPALSLTRPSTQPAMA